LLGVCVATVIIIISSSSSGIIIIINNIILLLLLLIIIIIITLTFPRQAPEVPVEARQERQARLRLLHREVLRPHRSATPDQDFPLWRCPYLSCRYSGTTLCMQHQVICLLD
jgi:hypothetical protein